MPDVDRFELNLEIAETQVSGTVVDKDSGEPVSDASVRLRRSSARTGPDGRFSIAVEPGEWQLAASAPGRKLTVLPLNVGPDGLSDVRVEMERGLELRGRVVDAAGRPLRVWRSWPPTRAVDLAETVYTLADGSFRIGGLGEEPYTLVSGGDLTGWAVRGGVTPGGEPVTLALRPGGRIAVRVLGADGRPVKDAYPDVQRVDGLAVVDAGRLGLDGRERLRRDRRAGGPRGGRGGHP